MDNQNLNNEPNTNENITPAPSYPERAQSNYSDGAGEITNVKTPEEKPVLKPSEPQKEQLLQGQAEAPTQEKGKSRRKVLLLFLLLIATGFLLTTTTYAWFTSNRTVTVGDINVNVASSGGIQLSVDGTNWKSIVSTSDITGATATYAAATNQLPSNSSALEPVSTALASLDSNGYLSMWHGTVVSNTGGNYILTTEDASTVTHGTSGYFVCFDLFFKVDAESATITDGTPTQVYLTTTSDVIADTTDTGIKNAARVAFIKEGSTLTGSDLATIQALKTSTVSGNIFLWEPNYDYHTASGVTNARDVYGITTVSSSTLTEGDGNPVVGYSGVTASVAASDDILLGSATAANYPAKFAAVTPTLTTEASWATNANGEYEEWFTLGANEITKVKVYFWVEGQDVDCENNASGGAITLKLQFSLNSQAE